MLHPIRFEQSLNKKVTKSKITEYHIGVYFCFALNIILLKYDE